MLTPATDRRRMRSPGMGCTCQPSADCSKAPRGRSMVRFLLHLLSNVEAADNFVQNMRVDSILIWMLANRSWSVHELSDAGDDILGST